MEQEIVSRENIKSGASSSLSSISPSFTSYSSKNLADIAARVVHELNLSTTDPYEDDFYSSISQHNPIEPNHDVTNDDNGNDDNDPDSNDDESESEFEFTVLCGEENASPISADEIFYNGQIKPTYPIFDTTLVYGFRNDDTASSDTPTLRLPLRSLMRNDKENGHGQENGSCSSSEVDELEGVPEGTYCVWAPQKKKEELMMKKKSKSTGSAGSSKRWRLRDLLYRSNSDGKDAFVFLTPHNHREHNNQGKNVGGVGKEEKVTAVKGKMINGRKRGVGEGKKKSYLPYRQDLVGLFSNVNGLSRTVRPF